MSGQTLKLMNEFTYHIVNIKLSEGWGKVSSPYTFTYHIVNIKLSNQTVYIENFNDLHIT